MVWGQSWVQEAKCRPGQSKEAYRYMPRGEGLCRVKVAVLGRAITPLLVCSLLDGLDE